MDDKDAALLKDMLSTTRQTGVIWKQLQRKYPHLPPLIWYDKNSAVLHVLDYLVQKYRPATIQQALDDYFSTRDLKSLHVSYTVALKNVSKAAQWCTLF